MLVLLSCAKTMAKSVSQKTPALTTPRFQAEANDIAMEMARYSVEELERGLRVNSKLGLENYQRFQQFHSPDTVLMPAVLGYTGIVFKKLNPKDFTVDDFEYAQQHLRLTSFCYGLLRPLDGIVPYRLEGDVRLPGTGGETLFAYWREHLTDCFIEDIKAAGGVLCNLASDEMRGLFDWPRVEREVRVITPEFKVWKGDKLKTIVVYTKMMRGEMTRYILKNRIENAEQLKLFTAEGFQFDKSSSDESHILFTLG